MWDRDSGEEVEVKHQIKQGITKNGRIVSYVKAERQVIQGQDENQWGGQITEYINEQIRKGKDVTVYSENGVLLGTNNGINTIYNVNNIEIEAGAPDELEGSLPLARGLGTTSKESITQNDDSVKYNPETKAMLKQTAEQLSGLREKYLDGIERAAENYRAAQEGATKSAAQDANVKEYMQSMEAGEDRQTALNGLVSQLFFTTQGEYLRANKDADLDEALQRFADALMQYRRDGVALRPTLEAAGFAAPQDMTALSYAADQLMRMEKDSGEEVEVKHQIKENVDINDETLEKNKSIIANMDSVKTLTGEEFKKGDKKLTEQVTEYFFELGGTAYNTELGDVELNQNGVEDTIGHRLNRKKAIAFAAVKEVIEQGKIIDAQKNWKGRKYDTYVIAAPIKIGSDDYYMGVVVMRKDENQRYQLHDLIAIQKSALGTAQTRSNTLPGDALRTINIILSELKNYKRENTGNDIKHVEVQYIGNIGYRKTESQVIK